MGGECLWCGSTGQRRVRGSSTILWTACNLNFVWFWNFSTYYFGNIVESMKLQNETTDKGRLLLLYSTLSCTSVLLPISCINHWNKRTLSISRGKGLQETGGKESLDIAILQKFQTPWAIATEHFWCLQHQSGRSDGKLEMLARMPSLPDGKGLPEACGWEQ